MTPELRTVRLVLRPLEPADAPWIAREIARPEVIRMLTSPPYPYALAHAEEWVTQVRTKPGHWVVEGDGAALGVITCSRDDRGEDLGYWLSRSAWGRGYMTEAARAVAADHFAAGADVLTSGYITDNPASARVLTKLGFAPAEVLQRWSNARDGEVPVQRMVLTRDRWSTLHG